MRPTATDPAVGARLAGRYELVQLIARGGMGDVYEAEDTQLQRRVAVKLFRGAATLDRARFDAEAVVLAGMNHPGLVQVYDAGEQDGDAFVVLELIEGPTLASRLADRGPIPSSEVAELGIQLADALDYVHQRGVVHRDVTPSNVLCGPDGRPRLADFGIARLVDTTRITASATTVGTAAYMAPEQVQGQDVTPTADVYALGLVLLELLTGAPAFTGSPHEVAVARLARRPDTDTGVPGAWRDLLAAMTDRVVSNRPSAAEVRTRIEAVLEGAAQSTGAMAAAALAPEAVAPPTVVVNPPPPSVVVNPPAAPAESAEDVTTGLPVAGGTTVMPAVLVPVDEAVQGEDGLAPEHERARRRGRRAALAVAGALLLAVTVAAASGGGPEVPAPTSTTTPAAPVVTAPPTTTPTTAPPTTAPPRSAARTGRRAARRNVTTTDGQASGARPST